MGYYFYFRVIFIIFIGFECTAAWGNWNWGDGWNNWGTEDEDDNDESGWNNWGDGSGIVITITDLFLPGRSTDLTRMKDIVHLLPI